MLRIIRFEMGLHLVTKKHMLLVPAAEVRKILINGCECGRKLQQGERLSPFHNRE
jgi:hypothetical protein